MTDEAETPGSEDLATVVAKQESGAALEVGQVERGRVVRGRRGGKGEAWILPAITET